MTTVIGAIITIGIVLMFAISTIANLEHLLFSENIVPFNDIYLYIVPLDDNLNVTYYVSDSQCKGLKNKHIKLEGNKIEPKTIVINRENLILDETYHNCRVEVRKNRNNEEIYYFYIPAENID